MGQKHEMWELYQLQSLPLRAKIQKTKDNIQQWINAFGRDGVYVSFSGGKDSTVLLDIAREVYPQVQAVFVDTGLEYPEVRSFVKQFDNVEYLKPKKKFEQVIKEYGYPFISKEVSDKVQGARYYMQRKLREPEPPIGGGKNSRYQQIMGTYPGKDGKPSAYNFTKYEFFLDAPFEISAKCCNVMKKAPVHTYGRKTGKKAITAQMASESRLRTSQWLKNGCNGFQMTSPISNPMAFWTEQDVLLYIKENSLKIASVYGDIVEDCSGSSQFDNQMSLSDFGIFDLERPLLKTTGCNRTGCVFCGFGCHLEKPQQGRFERLSTTHPKLFDYVMRGGHFNKDGMWQPSNGLGYWFIITWMREHGNINIAAPMLDEYRKKYSDSKAEELLKKGDSYGQTNRG